MSNGDDRVARLHREAPLTDIHIHPSVKAYLFHRDLWKEHVSGKSWFPYATRSDFNKLAAGGVRVVWNNVTIPEKPLFEQCGIVRLVASLGLPGYRDIMERSAFDATVAMLDAMNEQVRRHPDKAEVAMTPADVTRIAAAGKVAVVHVVEGGHSLDGDVNNLDRLANKGVVMLIPSHFFDNGITRNTRGIPKTNIASKLCTNYDFTWHHPRPVTSFGMEVLRRMDALGMLIDITHMHPAAREVVYDVVDPAQPIVASHVGVRAMYDHPYNLQDDEIEKIAARQGVIGVIFYTHWLGPNEPKNGLRLIWRTIQHVRQVTGSFDHIALGSDFDGFTDPPDDVKDASEMGKVTQLMLDEGIGEDDVKKVLGGNAQRVLERGWKSGLARGP